VIVVMKGNEAREDELPSIPKIDKTIHEPARLMIMAYLFVVESADFLFLQRQTQMTPGNLSAHLSKLEDAGYIEITKEFIERKPHTALALTKKGRDAFRQYRRDIKQIAERLPE
jgi:DNA-binding MarR family transcriptional regulator